MKHQTDVLVRAKLAHIGAQQHVPPLALLPLGAPPCVSTHTDRHGVGDGAHTGTLNTERKRKLRVLCKGSGASRSGAKWSRSTPSGSTHSLDLHPPRTTTYIHTHTYKARIHIQSTHKHTKHMHMHTATADTPSASASTAAQARCHAQPSMVLEGVVAHTVARPHSQTRPPGTMMAPRSRQRALHGQPGQAPHTETQLLRRN